MSGIERQPLVLTHHQKTLRDAAIDLHARGLYYCPSSIGDASTAHSLVRRGLLFIVDGVRHEETGNEVRGFGVVGYSYSNEPHVSQGEPRKAMRPSAYSKDIGILKHRSGITVSCKQCVSAAGVWCKSKAGNKLLYNHLERRETGKSIADSLVTAKLM